MLKTAKVIFDNSKYNYSTSVNGNLTNEQIRKYFEGTFFNVGSFPVENFQKCVKCEITNPL